MCSSDLTIDEIFSKNLNSKINASIIGRNTKTNILNAAFLNGISAHVLEFDDGHGTAQLHLGSVIFPTAIAISESYNLTGKEFILYNELISKDWFMTLLDLEDYIQVKERMLADYEDRDAWMDKVIVNIAKAGFFSSS